MLGLFRGLDPARAEAVAARDVAIGLLTCKSVASILQAPLILPKRNLRSGSPPLPLETEKKSCEPDAPVIPVHAGGDRPGKGGVINWNAGMLRAPAHRDQLFGLIATSAPVGLILWWITIPEPASGARGNDGN